MVQETVTVKKSLNVLFDQLFISLTNKKLK